MNIRKYVDADKSELRYICKETAFESYKKDPKKLETVPIMFNDYFTEQEPDNIFVLADDNDKAVGYIICSSDYEKFKRLMKTEYKARVKNIRPQESVFINVFMSFLGQIKERPVHFHIDILPEYQRQGWGTKLIDALCEHLKSNGIDHLSVCSVDPKSPGYKMYTKYGFKEYKKHLGGSASLTKDL